VTEISEEAGSIRITCSEGSSLGTTISFVCSCCFIFITVGPQEADMDCAEVATLGTDFALAASGGDLTLSVVPLLLIGWYLGMGNFGFV